MEPDPRFEEIRRLGGERYRAYLDAGFREHYTGEVHRAVFGSPYLLQKRVRSDVFGDTLYFLNVLVFLWKPEQKVSYQPECHLKRNGLDFRVTMIGGQQTPLEVELFFGDVYWDLGCDPYGD